ncbi:MAG: NOL1/NOP2/sun family putative RNA methylase, partial [Candidatus Nanoarchaeia archaeon]
CPESFYVEHETGRRDIGNTVEHSLGYFYVQEAVSMVPPLALDVKPGMKVLDMCAAPGSKTSQIAMMMKGEGVLIANDYKGQRLSSLGINLQRCGVSNAIITLMRGESFKKYSEEFDRVLVDAPCSGTGTIRKSLKTLRIWNPNMVRKLAVQQLRLLETGFECLKPGGIVVYSTCSLEPEEDEGVISKFLEKHPNAKVEKIKLKGLKHGPAVVDFDGNDYSLAKSTLRIWPQDNDTEGFFVAKIHKL